MVGDFANNFGSYVLLSEVGLDCVKSIFWYTPYVPVVRFFYISICSLFRLFYL